jgi:hypothetical protein
VDLCTRRTHEIDRNEMAHCCPVLLLDDEMSECSGDWINDDPSQFSAGAIAT